MSQPLDTPVSCLTCRIVDLRQLANVLRGRAKIRCNGAPISKTEAAAELERITLAIEESVLEPIQAVIAAVNGGRK